MDPALLILLTPLSGLAGAALVYFSTRKRDAPHAEAELGRLKLDDSRAALEAYVELAATMRQELVDLREKEQRIEALVSQLRAQRVADMATIAALEAELMIVRDRLTALTVKLDDCLAGLELEEP